MIKQVNIEKVYSIGELIDYVGQIDAENNLLYFRGENQDFKDNAFQPSIYRNPKLLSSEDYFYREMQRFNDHEFVTDRTAIDKLARIQHYNAPTRLIDISEDVLSATYFALDNKGKDKEGVVYVIEIKSEQIKYYDSDAVSVLANLAKLPLNKKSNKKSKDEVRFSAKKFLNDITKFNEQESVKFLLHEIKEEKSYFENIINPEHIFSVFCVKPKYNNLRIHTQKGAFLLFGLNKEKVGDSIKLLSEIRGKLCIDNSHTHPVVNIHKVILDSKIRMDDIKKLGISLPYVYPEIDKVGKYLLETIDSR